MSTGLSYTDTGKGNTVVLLHGFCESKDIWHYFREKLSKSFRVITPDLPGFGENPALESDITMEGMADALHSLLKGLHTGKCTLIAHSLGGYVSLAFAEKYPEMLNGIGLFHSTAYPDTPEKQESRDKVVDFLEKNGVVSFIEGFVAPLFHFKNRKYLQEEIELITRLGKKTPLSTAIHVTRAMRDRRDRTHVLQKVNFPVMFIAGREDKALDFKASQKQFLMPAQATIHVLPETAHMGMFERKDETLAMCEGFVRICNNNN
jgi:pimeloyl-ACP methyl ester carboxylesterase